MKKNLILFAFMLFQYLHAQITPTNYTLPANWSAGKMKGALDMKFDPSFTIVSPDTLTQTPVNITYDTASDYDLFCVYPTLILGNDSSPATQPINIVSKASADLALNWFASEFAQFGRVYAPYYRQANLSTFNPGVPFALQSSVFDTALTDVLAAFDYYMLNYNNGKKVILLGYSQGAVLVGMMLRKIESDSVHQPYLKKIYLSVQIGMESGPFVTQSGLAGGWWQQFPICQNATDTACIMSWDAHKYGQPVISFVNQIPVDTDFVALNFMYQNFNPTVHRLFMDHLGFDTTQKQIRFSVYPKSLYQQVTGTDYQVPSQFIGFTDMYYGSIYNPGVSTFGFMVDRIPNVPNDNRIDPVQLSGTSDLHVYDPYVNTGDVICLIYEKMGRPCPYNFDTTGTDTSTTAIKILNGSQGEFNIMPNPCKSNLHLALPSNQVVEITICDVLGQIIASYSNTRDIDVSLLANGIYMINATTPHQKWQRRFVKV